MTENNTTGRLSIKSLLFNQNRKTGTFLVVQWLGLSTSFHFRGATGVIPGQETKILPSREIIKIRELSRVDEVKINMPKFIMFQT